MMNYKTGNCMKCDTKAAYNDECDAYFCNNCNEFLEKPCSDKGCEFCINRPNKINDLETI